MFDQRYSEPQGQTSNMAHYHKASPRRALARYSRKSKGTYSLRRHGNDGIPCEHNRGSRDKPSAYHPPRRRK